MEGKTLSRLQAGEPLRMGGLTVVPIEQIDVAVGFGARRLFARAGKHAYGIVILHDGSARAMDASGAPLDLEELAGRTAGLREFLR